MKRGFRRKVHCTPATFELCRIMLPDSGFLQEEEARFANRHGFSKHAPALPLYTKEDAEASLDRFETRRVEEAFDVAPGVSATFHRAGHLLGAASVQIRAGDDTILFSGDLGRANDPLLKPPSAPPASDYLVVESTYGDLGILPMRSEAELGPIIRAASARGATIVMPAFAVGRAQLLLLLLARLKAKGAIPDLPVYLDSPMAIDATELYRVFTAEHRLSSEETAAIGRVATLVHSVEQSKALAHRTGHKSSSLRAAWRRWTSRPSPQDLRARSEESDSAGRFSGRRHARSGARRRRPLNPHSRSGRAGECEGRSIELDVSARRCG